MRVLASLFLFAGLLFGQATTVPDRTVKADKDGNVVIDTTLSTDKAETPTPNATKTTTYTKGGKVCALSTGGTETCTVSSVAGTGDVIGPATNSDGYVPQWNGADSKTLKAGLQLKTVVATPGVDTATVTEKAVRDAITAVVASIVGDNLGTATAADVAALFSGTGDYLKSDGTKGTPTGGGAGSAAEVVALFSSGTCAGYLKSDGSCDTPAGSSSPAVTVSSSGSPLSVTNQGFYYNNTATAFTYNLSTVTSGMVGYQWCFGNDDTRTGAITLQLPASTYMSKAGAKGTAAGTLVSAGALGDSVCVVAVSTTLYRVTSMVGAWTNN